MSLSNHITKDVVYAMNAPSPSFEPSNPIHLLDRKGQQSRKGTGHGSGAEEDSHSRLDFVAGVEHGDDESGCRKEPSLEDSVSLFRIYIVLIFVPRRPPKRAGQPPDRESSARYP